MKNVFCASSFRQSIVSQDRLRTTAGKFLKSEAVVSRRVLGRGAYIPKTADQVLSEFFYGFPQGTFMVSYNWTHPELPRRVARDLLPERPPVHPNKCWLDLEQLVPGRARRLLNPFHNSARPADFVLGTSFSLESTLAPVQLP